MGGILPEGGGGGRLLTLRRQKPHDYMDKREDGPFIIHKKREADRLSL